MAAPAAMGRRIALIASIILGTLASAAYWFAFTAVAFSILAGDYRAGEEPPEAQRIAVTAITWGAGLGLYAFGAWLWRRFDFWIAGRREKQDG